MVDVAPPDVPSVQATAPTLYDGQPMVANNYFSVASGAGGLYSFQPIGASVTLSPTAPSALSYVNPYGRETRLEFPAGAVSDTLVVKYVLRWDESLPPGLAFAHHAFALEASREGSAVPELTLSRPVSVTLHYDEEIGPITEENQLRLWWWNGNRWQDAASTCDPAAPYERDPIQNVLRLSICKGSRYALGGPTHTRFLPLASFTATP